MNSLFIHYKNKCIYILKDILDLTKNKKIIGKENLLFSDKIVKLDKYNMTKERIIIITNSKIYNLNQKSIVIFI